MESKKIVYLSVLFISVLAFTAVLSAEGVLVSADQPQVTSNNQQAAQENNDTHWAWGQITNLDTEAKTVTIKYLDYETDQEKELVLAVDDKTTFENAKGLDELKLKDTLSIDYSAGPDNKSIAKNISLEKPDAVMPAAPPSAQAKEEEKPVEAPVTAVEPVTPAETSVLVSEPPAPVAQPAAEIPAVAEAESAPAVEPALPPPAQ